MPKDNSYYKSLVSLLLSENYVKVLDYNFLLNINEYKFKFKNYIFLLYLIDIIF